jgi:hypothetical protein
MELERGSEMIRWIFAMLAIFVSLPGCFKEDRCPYGPEANADRRARGIAEIPLGWRHRFAPGQYEWWDPRFEDGKLGTRGSHEAFFRDKTLFADRRGNLQYEEDIYQTGRWFKSRDPDQDSPQAEQILVKYNFVDAASGRNPWVVRVLEGPLAGRTYTLEEGKAMLREFGLAWGAANTDGGQPAGGTGSR